VLIGDILAQIDYTQCVKFCRSLISDIRTKTSMLILKLLKTALQIKIKLAAYLLHMIPVKSAEN